MRIITVHRRFYQLRLYGLTVVFIYQHLHSSSLPQHTSKAAAMEDGSGIRIKVAQSLVNKNSEDLENAKFKPGGLPLLQALPRYSDDGSTDSAEVPAHVSGQPTKLPPFFPPGSGDDSVTWKRVLEGFKAHQPTPDEKAALPTPPPWYKVAIIGGGVAGLRTAMLLQRVGIPYKILEASDRPGGRLYTYEFASKSPGNPQGKHDYYDVGGMRFPDNDANKTTFELFKELDLAKEGKIIKYVFSLARNIRYYNGEC